MFYVCRYCIFTCWDKCYISPAVGVFYLEAYIVPLFYDSDEGGRQSKMVGDSKLHAISETAYARANVNAHAVWEMTYSMTRILAIYQRQQKVQYLHSGIG